MHASLTIDISGEFDNEIKTILFGLSLIFARKRTVKTVFRRALRCSPISERFAMSKAVAKASPLKPEIRLAQAVSQFEAALSAKQKTEFRDLKSQTLAAAPCPNDVMLLTAEIDRQLSANSRCVGPRFTNFLQGVQQFAALADIVVGGSQNIIACSVWSLVRMSVLVGVCFFVVLSLLLIHFSLW